MKKYLNFITEGKSEDLLKYLKKDIKRNKDYDVEIVTTLMINYDFDFLNNEIEDNKYKYQSYEIYIDGEKSYTIGFTPNYIKLIDSNTYEINKITEIDIYKVEELVKIVSEYFIKEKKFDVIHKTDYENFIVNIFQDLLNYDIETSYEYQKDLLDKGDIEKLLSIKKIHPKIEPIMKDIKKQNDWN